MPKYFIVHTPVRYGAEKAKQATRYEVDDVIELTEKEAQKLGDNAALIKDEVKKPADKDAAGKETAPDTGSDPDDKGNSPEGEKPDKGKGSESESGKEKEKKKQQ